MHPDGENCVSREFLFQRGAKRAFIPGRHKYFSRQFTNAELQAKTDGCLTYRSFSRALHTLVCSFGFLNCAGPQSPKVILHHFNRRGENKSFRMLRLIMITWYTAMNHILMGRTIPNFILMSSLHFGSALVVFTSLKKLRNCTQLKSLVWHG